MLNKLKKFSVSGLAILLIVILMALPTGYEDALIYQDADRVRARVLSTDESTVVSSGLIQSGEQICELEILDGRFAGETAQGVNMLSGSLESDKIFEEGDVALVVISYEGDTIRSVTMSDHYRLDKELLLAVLFVLFVQVMPVFEDVYEQLGAQLSPVASTAIRFGGVCSGVALAAGAVLLLVCAAVWALTRMGKRFLFLERLVSWGKKRSRIALAVANRRFTSVLALTLRSGLELEKGLELAAELAENPAVEGKIQICRDLLEEGQSYYDALKATGLFSGFHIQMIKTGNRSGHLDRIMDDISRDYEQQADEAIDNVISRFEPTMVAVLAVAVGLVLLSVMLPLAGVLSTIG